MIFDLLILFIASLTPLLWFSDNKILTGHDSGFPLNSLMHFIDRLYLWTNRFGFGKDQTMEAGGFFIHLQEAVLQYLGFSLQDSQKIIFISWFFMLGISLYILARVLFNHKKYRFLALLAALFYMFNTYTVQSWPVAERTKFSLMIALPLTLSILIRFFQERLSIVKTAGLLGLVFFFFNAGGANGLPHFGALMVLILPAFLFLFFTTLGEEKYSLFRKEQTCLFYLLFKKIIPLGAIFLIIWFFLNSYWLLPFLYYTHNSLAQAIGERGGFLGTSAWLDVVSQNTSIPRLLRLQGEPGWYGTESTHPYGAIYLQNAILIFISFLWPILAFLAIVISKKEEKKTIFLLLIIALVAIFFAAGSHFPTGVVFSFLFEHFPGFLIFRSAWFKFNYGITLAYSILIGYTISRIYSWLKDKRQKILSYLLLGGFGIILAFYNFPYFGKQMFVWNKPLSLMVNVPQYIFDFGKWAKSLSADTRFLVLPPLDKQWSGLAYSWGYFSSTTPYAVLINKAMYSNYEFLPTNEKELLTIAYEDLLSGNEQEAQKILELLQVDYILLQKDALSDLAWYKTIPTEEFFQSLTKFFWILPYKTFGEWQVYKVEREKATQSIYLNSEAVMTNLPASDFAAYKTKNDLNHLYINTEKNEGLAIKNFVWKTECLNCEMEKINFFLPDVKILPGSRFYKFFVSDKEKKLLATKNTLNFSQKIDLYLGLSLKRLAEIDRLTEAAKGEKALLPLAELKDYLNKIKNLLENTKEPETKLVFSQKRLLNFNEFARKKLGFFERRGIDEPLRTEFNDILKSLADLDNKVLENRIWKEVNRKIYTADIPITGEYKIEVLNNSIGNVQLSLDGKQIDNEQLVNISQGQHILVSVILGSESAQGGRATPESKGDGFWTSQNDGEKPVLIAVSQTEPKAAALPKFKTKRLDQTKYILDVSKPENYFFLYFNDTFNPNWKVYADDKPIPEERHFTANGFGNAWLVKKEDFRKEGIHTLGLSYLPQSFFQLGMVISGVSFVMTALLL